MQNGAKFVFLKCHEATRNIKKAVKARASLSQG